jgi:murein DD-endopeptidase MepM/ murein hydrolase activator NlpD
MKRLLTVISLIIISVTITIPTSAGKVFAESASNSTENSLEENEVQLNEIKDETNKLNDQLVETQEQMEAKENEINETSNEIDQIENEIDQKAIEMDQLKQDIVELIDRIEKREELIIDRLRSIQQNGGSISYLEVLFGSKSFGDFIGRAILTTKIMDQDKSIMEAQKQDKLILEEKETKLAEDQIELESHRKKMEEEKVNLLNQKQELTILESDLKDNLDKNKNKLKKLEEKQLELKESQAKLEKEKTSLKVLSSSNSSNQSNNNTSPSSEDTAKGNGQFVWPTIGGQITSYQGMRWGKFHKGIDIAGPSDYSILAADSGKVTYAGWINGYGKTIKLDHNNGYITQYAHLNSINVNVGDVVSAGDNIGVMGSTGRSTGIHLDFEVYLNGKLLNPVDVLP